MLNFFVKLINLIGIPIVLVGTPQAIRDLTAQFRMARRGAGHGDLIWHRMQADDADWELLLTALWEHAYLQQMPTLTPALSRALHMASCGITDVAIRLFMFAQRRALDEERETIAPEDFLRIAEDDLVLLNQSWRPCGMPKKRKRPTSSIFAPIFPLCQMKHRRDRPPERPRTQHPRCPISWFRPFRVPRSTSLRTRRSRRPDTSNQSTNS